MPAIRPNADHRPYPPPRGPWVMAMQWHDLLFMHWPVPAEALRPFVPPGLEVETFDGSAWLGIVPFRMAGTRGRWLPRLPGTHAFPELNVRTYVRPAGAARFPSHRVTESPSHPFVHSGVWFFSLDAASRLAVRGARAAYRLPYFDATMTCRDEAGWVWYDSRRTDRRRRLCFGAACPAEPALQMRYRPTGPEFHAAPDSLEEFLTGRYRLFAWSGRRILRAEIDHGPWPLQPAEAVIEKNTMAAALGIDLAGRPPRLHFARRLDVVGWWPRPASPVP